MRRIKETVKRVLVKKRENLVRQLVNLPQVEYILLR